MTVSLLTIDYAFTDTLKVRAIRDLKECTLVSRGWYDYATQDLWHTFSSDFAETPTRSREALLRRGSAPLRLVKRVILRKQAAATPANHPGTDVEDNFISFLTSVNGTSTRSRRGPIVEISCETPIPKFAFRLITMMHQNLEVCRVAFEVLNDSQKCLSRDDWHGKYVEALTTLQINVAQHNNLGRVKSHWDTYRFTIKNTKKLHTLEIQKPLHDQAFTRAPIQEALTMRIPEPFNRRNILNLTELSLK